MGKNDSGEDLGIGLIGSALVLHSAADGHFLCFTVLIDGKRAGVIFRGNSERYPLAHGDHDLVVQTGISRYSGWNRFRSPRICFVVKPDADCEAACGSNPLQSKKTWLVGASMYANLMELTSEIGHALFPQHRFWMGNPLDALIVGLLSASILPFGRAIVYWPDGPVWCKLK